MAQPTSRSYDYLIKLLMIGDSSVGKSAILLRYSENEFNSTFISTIGVDYKIKTIDVDGKTVKLQIWDTAGQERFRTITTNYYRGAMGILLVYDVTNQRSFNSIRTWADNIEQHADPNVKKIILGNKSDLEDQRVIPTQHGRQIAAEYGVDFFETSAKANINITDAFNKIIREIIKGLPPGQVGPVLNSTANLGKKSNASKGSCCKSS